MKRNAFRAAGRMTLLGAVCWFAYFSIYLGRLNFSASMSEMIHRGLWGKGQLGSVAAAFYLAYGLGQAPSGLLGDRLPPGRMVFMGLAGSAMVNLFFPLAQNMALMHGLWFANGLFQAMIWPPMVRLVTDMADGKRAVNIILLLSFSSPAGMLFTYLASALLLKGAGWEYCFWGAGIWLILVAALWGITVKALSRRMGTGEKGQTPETGKERRKAHKRSAFPVGLISVSLFWFTGAAFIHGILKDGLTTWIPTYLTEEFSIQPFLSVMLTTFLPVVNLSGVSIAQFGNRRIFRNEAAAGAACYAISLASILGMMWVAGSTLYGTVILFAVVTSMMTAVNTLVISLLPLHFRAQGRVATISGVLNAVTYLGSAAASALFGYTTEYGGWRGTQAIWGVCAGVGLLFCLLAIRRWGRIRKDIYAEKEEN